MSKEWTTTEVEVLKHFASLGAEGVAQLLERSKSSVESRARDLGVSLKASKEDIDLRTTPARLLRYVHLSPDLQLCPVCGVRLAMMTSTGICRVCHLDRLIELRAEQLEIRAREKRLASLRQDKKRLRICESCGSSFFPRVESADTRCSKCGPDE